MANKPSILLVEDSDRVRALIVQILAPTYEVTEASTAAAAREHLGNGCKAKLLISDVMLPGESGLTLAAYAREQRPGIAVLLMSGYALGAEQENEFIEKPFLPDQLLDRVSGLLSRAPA